MVRQSRLTLSAILFLLAALLVMVVAVPMALTLGSVHIPWQSCVRILGARILPFWISIKDIPPFETIIVWMVRTPRIVIAGAIGAGLAIAGSLMQGLFRNPIAESNVIG